MQIYVCRFNFLINCPFENKNKIKNIEMNYEKYYIPFLVRSSIV